MEITSGYDFARFRKTIRTRIVGIDAYYLFVLFVRSSGHKLSRINTLQFVTPRKFFILNGLS